MRFSVHLFITGCDAEQVGSTHGTFQLIARHPHALYNVSRNMVATFSHIAGPTALDVPTPASPSTTCHVVNRDKVVYRVVRVQNEDSGRDQRRSENRERFFGSMTFRAPQGRCRRPRRKIGKFIRKMATADDKPDNGRHTIHCNHIAFRFIGRWSLLHLSNTILEVGDEFVNDRDRKALYVATNRRKTSASIFSKYRNLSKKTSEKRKNGTAFAVANFGNRSKAVEQPLSHDEKQDD